jgi:alpha-L-rhamnosidase
MKTRTVLLTVIILLVTLIQSCHSRCSLNPSDLRCENLKDPQVVDISEPRLSWINVPEKESRGVFQTAWEIRVAGTKEELLSEEADLWNSGKVSSEESFNIKYGGRPLASRQDCWWQVKVWDNEGNESGWSAPAFWSMGILNDEEWKARWIGAPWQDEVPLKKPPYPRGRNPAVSPFATPVDKLPPPAPLLRKNFSVSKDIKSARAYVTGLGFFEFFVNGEKAGNDVMVPNVTLYGKRDDIGPIGAMTNNNFREYRVMYLAYDIKSMLKKGENSVGAILGNGFYNPGSFWTQGYGTPRFLGQIHITYSDGTEDVIISDNSWRAYKSPIIMDLVYDGEHYDAQMEQQGWSSPGFDDSGWENAALRTKPEGKMKAHMSPADKVMESLSPQKIEQLGEGHFKIDFGQEISGWIHLFNIKGEKGRKIDIKYLCESPVGDNSYTMRGGDPESYAARFTWFVFREVEILNWPGDLKPEHIRAEAVYSDIGTTGNFECSNELFNTINKIWWRSQTDNMHGGIASDCPHRERSPYTGDGQVACVTVIHNFDARAFYTKWIQDILGAQNPENGYVPNGAPWQPGCGGGVGWGAAMNIMPWEYFLHYGDYDLLENNYEGMKGYIRYMLTWTNKEGIMYSQAPEKSKPNRWINLGDWVSPGNLPPDEMVHTFFLWRCSDITSKTAKILGKTEDMQYFRMIADKTRLAFQKTFFDEDKGTYGPNGGNILALKMGLPDEQKKVVTASLKEDISSNGDHLDTGIFGTQFFFEVLSENGLHELACKVMNQRTQPGYGWWIEQGATTTWEKWDGEGSRNHPMFGGGLTWFYRKLAGMNADPDNPGYKHIIFKPQPADDIFYTTYSTLTPFGKAGISWKKDNGKFIMDVIVPAGSRATVYIPADKKGDVTESGKEITDSEIIKFSGIENGYVVFNIGSGEYKFSSEITTL